jgi:hypothetical protein
MDAERLRNPKGEPSQAAALREPDTPASCAFLGGFTGR